MDTIKSKVAGTSFDDRNEIIEKYCKKGMELILEREPDNHADSNAIMVFVETNKGEEQIGYVTKEAAKTVAEYMDNGKTITATITKVTGGTASKPSYGVNIDLELDGSFGLIRWIMLFIILFGVYKCNSSDTVEQVKPAKTVAVKAIEQPVQQKQIIVKGWEITHTIDETTRDKLDGVSKQAVNDEPNKETPSLTIFCRKNEYTIFINWHQKLPKELNSKTVLDGKDIPSLWERSAVQAFSQYNGRTISLINELTVSNSLTIYLGDARANFNLTGLYMALLKANSACLG